jgi:hypothetical protein
LLLPGGNSKSAIRVKRPRDGNIALPVVKKTPKQKSADLIDALVRDEITVAEFFRVADEFSDDELRSLANMLRKLANVQKVRRLTKKKAG